jgi:hypothetical protein
MAIQRSVLMVELLMSADRVIIAAQSTTPRLLSDGWPPATVVGHLSQVDTEVWLPRIDQMVIGQQAGVPPTFAWWEPEAQQTLTRFAGMSPDETGAQLLASRTLLLHRLRELADEDWDACAEHEAFGSLDIEGLMLQVLSHDEEHRASILLGQPEV